MVVIIASLISMALLLFLVQLLLTMKELNEFSRLNSLESGFESLKVGLYISSPFFFLAVLFVLFDLELLFLFPGILISKKEFFSMNKWVISLVLILMTLALEWIWSGLKWQI